MFLVINIVGFYYGPPNLEDGEQSYLEIIMQGTEVYIYLSSSRQKKRI